MVMIPMIIIIIINKALNNINVIILNYMDNYYIFILYELLSMKYFDIIRICVGNGHF